MRFILFIILMGLLANYCNSQNKYQIKKEILPASLIFIAGAFDGLNQVISYQYPSFKKAFPNATDQFWSPQLSFRNKYKNGDPAQGAKFPGSKSVLVFLTDGYHFSRFGERLFLSGALAVKIGQDKKKWWVYFVQGIGYWFINRIGFALVYNSIK